MGATRDHSSSRRLAGWLAGSHHAYGSGGVSLPSRAPSSLAALLPMTFPRRSRMPEKAPSSSTSAAASNAAKMSSRVHAPWRKTTRAPTRYLT